MKKMVNYDFSVDSVVSVEAPIGTDPESLIRSAKIKLVHRINDNDVDLVFENVFDPETGAYSEDWSE